MQCHYKNRDQLAGNQPGSVCASFCGQPLYFCAMGTKGGGVVKFSCSFLCRMFPIYCLFVPVNSIKREQSAFSLICLWWILSQQPLRPRRWHVICCLSARMRTRVDLSVTVALQLYTLRGNRTCGYFHLTLTTTFSLFFLPNDGIAVFIPFLLLYKTGTFAKAWWWADLFFFFPTVLRQSCEHTAYAEPHVCFASRLQVTYPSTCDIQNKPLVSRSCEISS